MLYSVKRATKPFRSAIIHSVTMNFLFLILLACYHLTNYSIYSGKNVFTGKKILCVNSNPKYLIEDADCSIKLMNRTHQRYNVSYRLHPNVTINSFSVSIKNIRIKIPKQLQNSAFLNGLDFCGVIQSDWLEKCPRIS